MPEVERKKTELSISIKETSASKSRAKMSVVREPGMSVTDTAKKVMKKLLVNLSNKFDNGSDSVLKNQNQTGTSGKDKIDNHNHQPSSRSR